MNLTNPIYLGNYKKEERGKEMEQHLSSLPMNTLKDIPTPHANAQQIVGLIKESGRITGYQLSNGKQLEKAEAIRLAREGGISGVGVASRNGSEYLKSLPDNTEGNNLGNLPSVSRN